MQPAALAFACRCYSFLSDPRLPSLLASGFIELVLMTGHLHLQWGAVLMPTGGDSGHVRLALDGGHATRLVGGPSYVIAGLFVGPLNYYMDGPKRIQ